jgi:ubiquinone/menaquinone biosynthesis C-methylase UbiE
MAPVTSPTDFDIEREAWDYVRARPHRQTLEQMRAYVNDLVTKDAQAQAGLRYFYRDVPGSIKGKTLLEFGCGTGGLALAFQEESANVVGVDIDRQALGFAHRWGIHRGSACRFVAVGETLPFRDETFDLVFSSSTFEHVAHPEGALRELARVLRPQGTVYLCFPNRLYPQEAHTNIMFLPWLPRRLAEAYLSARLPGWSLEVLPLWFYSYPAFLKVLRRSGANLRVVCPPVEGSNWKAVAKRVLHAARIPYSALTPGLALRLERSR